MSRKEFKKEKLLFGSNNYYYQAKVETSNELQQLQKEEINKSICELYSKFEKDVSNNIKNYYDKNHVFSMPESYEILSWMFKTEYDSFEKQVNYIRNTFEQLNSSKTHKKIVMKVIEGFEHLSNQILNSMQEIANEEICPENDAIIIHRLMQLHNIYYRTIEEFYFDAFIKLNLLNKKFNLPNAFLTDDDCKILNIVFQKAVIELRVINTVVYAITERILDIIHYFNHEENQYDDLDYFAHELFNAN